MTVKHDSNFLLNVLDWVLAEQLAGRRPNDHDVSEHFNITLEEAIKIHNEIDASESE